MVPYCLPRSRLILLLPQLALISTCCLGAIWAQESAESKNRELFAVPAADRQLNERKLKKLLEYGDAIVDPNIDRSERYSRADFFGRTLRHRYCMPSLLAVLRNPMESHELRHICLC